MKLYRLERRSFAQVDCGLGWGSAQELESEQLDSQLLEPSPAPSTRIAAPQAATARPSEALPSAPNKVIKANPQKTAEELELEALEAEMAA